MNQTFPASSTRAATPRPRIAMICASWHRDIVEQAMGIAADICIFTNRNLTIVELE